MAPDPSEPTVPSLQQTKGITTFASIPEPDVHGLKPRCDNGIAPLSVPQFIRWTIKSEIDLLPLIEIQRWKHQKAGDWWHEFLVVKIAPVSDLLKYTGGAKFSSPDNEVVSEAEMLSLIAKGLTFRIDRGRRMRSGGAANEPDDTRAAPVGGRSHQQILDLIEIMRPEAETTWASKKVYAVEKMTVVPGGAPEQFIPRVSDLNFILTRLISVDPYYDLFGHNCWSMAASLAFLIEAYFRFYWHREQLELPQKAKPHVLVRQLQQMLGQAFGTTSSAETSYEFELSMGEAGALFRPDGVTLLKHPARGLYLWCRGLSASGDVEAAAKILHPLTRQLGWTIDLVRLRLYDLLEQFIRSGPVPPQLDTDGKLPLESALGVAFSTIEMLSSVGVPGIVSIRDSALIEPIVELGHKHINSPVIVHSVLTALIQAIHNPAGAPHARAIDRAVKAGAIQLILNTLDAVQSQIFVQYKEQALKLYIMLASRKVASDSLMTCQNNDIFVKLVLTPDGPLLLRMLAIKSIRTSSIAHEGVQELVVSQSSQLCELVDCLRQASVLYDDETESFPEVLLELLFYLGQGSQQASEMLLDAGYIGVCAELLHDRFDRLRPHILGSFRVFGIESKSGARLPSSRLLQEFEKCELLDRSGNAPSWSSFNVKFIASHRAMLALTAWVSCELVGAELVAKSELFRFLIANASRLPPELVKGFLTVVLNVSSALDQSNDEVARILEALAKIRSHSPKDVMDNLTDLSIDIIDALSRGTSSEREGSILTQIRNSDEWQFLSQSTPRNQNAKFQALKLRLRGSKQTARSGDQVGDDGGSVHDRILENDATTQARLKQLIQQLNLWSALPASELVATLDEYENLLSIQAQRAMENGGVECLIPLITHSDFGYSRRAIRMLIQFHDILGPLAGAEFLRLNIPEALVQVACVENDYDPTERLVRSSLALSMIIILLSSNQRSKMKRAFEQCQALSELLKFASQSTGTQPPVAALAIAAMLSMAPGVQDQHILHGCLCAVVTLFEDRSSWAVIVTGDLSEDLGRSLVQFLHPTKTRNQLLLAVAIYAETGSFARAQIASYPGLLSAVAKIIQFRKSAAITDSLYRAIDVLHSVAGDDMDTVADFIKYKIPSILIDLLAAGSPTFGVQTGDTRPHEPVLEKSIQILGKICETSVDVQEAIMGTEDIGLGVLVSALDHPAFQAQEQFLILHILFCFVSQPDSPSRHCGDRVADAGALPVLRKLLEKPDMPSRVQAMAMKVTYRTITSSERTVTLQLLADGFVPLIMSHLRNPNSLHQLLAAGCASLPDFIRSGDEGRRAILNENVFDVLGAILNNRETEPNARRVALLTICAMFRMHHSVVFACAMSNVVPAIEEHLANPSLYAACGPNHVPMAKQVLGDIAEIRNVIMTDPQMKELIPRSNK